MSVQDFITRLQEDREFAQAMTDADEPTTDALLTECGITRTELAVQAKKEIDEAQALSDDELDTVAGGSIVGGMVGVLVGGGMVGGLGGILVGGMGGGRVLAAGSKIAGGGGAIAGGIKTQLDPKDPKFANYLASMLLPF